MISLAINLTKVDATLVGSTVSGVLEISNSNKEKVEYLIQFKLICTDKDYCEQVQRALEVFSETPESPRFVIG